MKIVFIPTVLKPQFITLIMNFQHLIQIFQQGIIFTLAANNKLNALDNI